MATKTSKAKTRTRVKAASARATVEKPKKSHIATESKGLFWSQLVKPHIILLAIIVLFVIAFFSPLKSLFVVATVNGEPISRIAVIAELEKKSGKQVLNNMIIKTLVYQEAKKKNVTVSDKEAQSQLKTIENNFSKTGQNLNQALAAQGMIRADLLEQIRLEKLIEKMVTKDVKVTNKEVDDYIEKNKQSLPQDEDPKQLRASIKNQLQQQKLSTTIQNWIQNLQANAKITPFVNY